MAGNDKRYQLTSQGDQREALKSLMRALGVIVAMLAVFSAGFAAIFHIPPMRAVYATIVTMTTLGDAGITANGAVQETWIALTSVAGVAGGIATIASLTSFGWSEFFRRARDERQLKVLRDHIVIAGGGRVGRRAALEAIAAHQQVIVLERDPRIAADLAEAGVTCLQGDAADRELLERAGLGQAAGFIAALPDDAANLYTVMLAHDARPEMPIAARAADERAAEMLTRAGAERVVLPEVSAGRNLANFISRPTIIELIEDGSVEEVRLGPGAPAVGKTLGEVSADGFTGIVAAVKREGRFLTMIQGDTVFESGDTLLLVGDPERLQREIDRLTG